LRAAAATRPHLQRPPIHEPGKPTPEAGPELDPALFQAALDELQQLLDQLNNGQRDPVN
jgi:hypothetical protein